MTLEAGKRTPKKKEIGVHHLQTRNEAGKGNQLDIASTSPLPVIDGDIVPERRCLVNICGVKIFGDEFSYYANPKIVALVLVAIILTTGVAGILLKSKVDPLSSPQDNFVSMAPSASSQSDIMNIRDYELGKVIFDYSGLIMLEENSPQHQALAWILHEDEMRLTHTSPNLLQRYSLMVMFYTLSGQDWKNKDGYGSDQHECLWFGVMCSDNQKVIRIELLHNNLNGQLPKEALLPNLAFIHLAENQITGTIPTEIGALTKLQVLYLSSNRLTGTIPDEIKKCRIIEKFSIANNRLVGVIPSSLEELQFLRMIHLSGNQLVGPIPSNLSKLPFLESIRVNNNQLTSTIPPEIGSYEYLEVLDLSQNDMSGTIPVSLRHLDHVKSIILSGNKLTGMIPQELGDLSTLIGLWVGNNNLNGTIPSSLGSLSKLNSFDLSNNRLSGTMPSSFDNLLELNSLQLHGNMITGVISEEICGFPLITFTADCIEPDGKVSCSCCTKCF